MEDKDMIEVPTHRAMIEFPESAVEIDVHAKIYSEGELIDVSKKYNLNEIREMFRKADEGYIDDDDRFVLTDKGREWLEDYERGGGSDSAKDQSVCTDA